MSIDGPEYGAVRDPRGADPSLKRPDGTVHGPTERDADLAPQALLIGLRPPDGQNDPFPDLLEVNEVNCGEFGTSKATCKSG
jgi:hypothetical protein